MTAQLYVTLAALQARLAQDNATTTWTAAQAAMQATICTQVNEDIEAYTGRAIGSDANTVYTVDGRDALENGYCLYFNGGIRSVSLLEIAPYTGGTFATIPSTDYFVRPPLANRQPGWPGFELWMTNIPSPGNPYPIFFDGYQNVRVTGTFGWAEMPNDVREAAELEAVDRWQNRRGGAAVSADAYETTSSSRQLLMSTRDRIVRYRWRNVVIV